jgi:hypothetical protein
MERCIEVNVAFVYLLGVSFNITNGAVMLYRCRFSCMPTRNSMSYEVEGDLERRIGSRVEPPLATLLASSFSMMLL